MSRLRWALVSCVVLFAVSAAADIDFNFAGDQIFGPSITIGGVTITGFYWTGTAWSSVGVQLVGRDEFNISPDHGLGICSPGENCTDGNQNEISNQLHPEIFQLSGLTTWKGVKLSSMDNNSDVNGSGSGPFEHGALFTSNLDASQLNLDNLKNIAGVNYLCGFSITGLDQLSPPLCNLLNPPPSEEPNIALTPASTNTFLYLQAIDLGQLTNVNNDYLLRGVLTDTPVPEPGSLSLFATGLAAASLAIRRKLRG